MKNLIKKFRLLILFILFVVPVQLNGQNQTSASVSGTEAFIRGIEAFEFEEYDKAEELLNEAYRQLGAKPGVSFALADLYLQLDDLPKAALYGKEAVERDPDNKWYRFKLAEIYKSAGKNDATIEELQRLLEKYPNDTDALFMLADTYRDYNEPIKSNQYLDRIIELTGPGFQVNYTKFLNYRAIGDSQSAIEELKTIREIDPENLETLNLLGELYLENQQANKAKEVLKEALARNARDPQSLIQLAGIYIDEAKWDSAGTLIGTLMKDKVVSPENKMQVARYMFTRQGNDPDNVQLKIETSRILDLFTEQEREYGPAFSLSGQFYIETGEPDKALEKLTRANELLPSDEIPWRQRLQLLLSQRKTDQAIEVGKEANKHVPEDAFIQFFIGNAYLLKEEYKQAVKWLEQASRAPARQPFKSAIYSSLGDSYQSLDDWENAKRTYELALRYDENNHNAMNNYAYALAQRQIELERAKEMALKAIELDSDNAAYLDTVGWVYYMLGDYDRARRFIRASIDTGSASAEVLEHLGDVYDKLDQSSQAKKWWQQALEMDPERTHLKEKINS